MADDIPPVKGEAFTFYVTLVSQANTKIFQVNPTLAVGDAKVSIDGGVLNPITTPPDVLPLLGKQVRVQLSGLETNGAKIGVLFSDVAGSEWCDGYWGFLTGPQQIGDLAIPGDEMLLTSTYNAAKTASQAGDAMTLEDDAITAAKIAADAIGSSELAATAASEIATAVWATTIRTLSSYGTLVAGVATAVWAEATRTLSSISAIAPDIWGYSSRTLTQSATQVAAAVSGSVVSVNSYTTWTIALTGLGNISTRTKLYFTAKRNYANDADSASIAQIEETAGLLYIDGAVATTAANGDITVDNQVAGNITVIVKVAETDISPVTGRYGVKMVSAAGVDYLVEGEFIIETPVPRVIT